MPYWNWAGKIAYFGLKIGKGPKNRAEYHPPLPPPQKNWVPPTPHQKKRLRVRNHYVAIKSEIRKIDKS